MSKKELSIKIDYLSIIFDNLKAEELIRKVLGLPLEYFMIQKAKVKHKDYTNLYQFGTIKVYGDRQSKDGTSEPGCYLVLSDKAVMIIIASYRPQSTKLCHVNERNI